MEPKKLECNVACIVGRFQLHQLSEAHKELIIKVLTDHKQVLIVLGLSPVNGSINNPLGFNARKQMILEEFPPALYPNINVLYIKDVPNDDLWSKNLDQLIKDHTGPVDKVMLYGGRDSFLVQYKGRFPTCELTSNRHISGTEIRKKLAEAPQADPLFRAGVVYGSFQRFPTAFPTVDIACYDAKNQRLLLARKVDETQYRFPGGFTDPQKDDCFEDAAARELQEETGISISAKDMIYLGSKKINDWRYKNEKDKIFTNLFIAPYVMGAAEADDDIAETRWFYLKDINSATFVSIHVPLWDLFQKFIQNNKA